MSNNDVKHRTIVKFNVNGKKYAALASTLLTASAAAPAVGASPAIAAQATAIGGDVSKQRKMHRLARLTEAYLNYKASAAEGNESSLDLVLDEDGCVFIDRDEQFFACVLELLRAGATAPGVRRMPAHLLPTGQNAQELRVRFDLMRELHDYYELTDLAALVAPRTFAFDPAHCSSGLKVNEQTQLSVTLTSTAIGTWHAVRSALPIITDEAIIETQPLLSSKFNRFSISIDRDINVMSGAEILEREKQDKQLLLSSPSRTPEKEGSGGKGHVEFNTPLTAHSSSGAISLSSSFGKKKRASIHLGSSKHSDNDGAKSPGGNLPSVANGTVLQFTSMEKLNYQPCKLQIGVVNAQFQCVPSGASLIAEGKEFETMQPIKTPSMYVVPVLGSLKSSDVISVYFDVKNRDLYFYKNDSVIHKYMNVDNIGAGKVNWYFVVCCEVVQPGRSISIVPGH